MSELIVATTGLAGTGKTTHTELLRDRHGFKVLSPPKILEQYANDHGIVLNGPRSQWADVRRRIGEENGPDWLTDLAFEDESEKLVIDGLSTVGDFDTLEAANQTQYARVAFVGLVCTDDNVRLEHLKAQQKKSKTAPRTVDEMHSMEADELYYELDAYSIARQTVLDHIPESMIVKYNDESVEAVHARIVALLERENRLT